MNTQANPLAQGIIREGTFKLENLEFNTKFWTRNPSLWKQDKEHQEFIVKFLGWQKVYDWTLERLEEVTSLAQDVKANFKHCVVMGMGGSSLAPEVFRTVFGKQSGWPELIVLDTTQPDWVASARARINPAETLFIFASKSGGTVEPSSQFAYFFDEVKKSGVKEPGKNFIAITDENTGLQKLAAQHHFRHTFINPSDIGGRFSALSFFGIVPAAIMGVDVHLYVIGRKKRMIVRFDGSKLFPVELESVIKEVRGVIDCYVVPAPDPDHAQGKVPYAFVVTEKPDVQARVEKDIIRMCRSKLPVYLQPYGIKFIEDMPRNSMGKTDYLKLIGMI